MNTRKPLKVLVACEFSGRVRDAFIRNGHEAMSCDLLPSEQLGPHYQGDIRDILDAKWDMMIAHPPCTYLTRTGARWHWGTLEQKEALEFVRLLMNAPISQIAIENPPGRIGTALRKADQYIQPWMFGHPENKTTGLWLKNLPLLTPTHIVESYGTYAANNEPPGPDRWKVRSRTYHGIASAMANQWGKR